MNARPIKVARRPVSGTVRIPGSKSLTNRALVLGALADGVTLIEGALHAEDTLRMAEGLRRLGVLVAGRPGEERFVVQGQGGRIPAAAATVDAGDAGTVARFLTAVAALGRGRYVIDGSPRMRERPIQDLVKALRALGVDVTAPSGCPPVYLHADGVAGGRTTVRGASSSQFLSALLLVAPLSASDVHIAVEGNLVARPYVDLTLRIMETFGASVGRNGHASFTCSPQRYRPRTFHVEPDASSASYFFALAALTGGRVVVPGLRQDSLQGDVRFLDILKEMGCRVHWTDRGVEVEGPERLKGVDCDMNTMPDVTITLAAIAPFAEGPVRIRNVAHIRHHESDRLNAVAGELRRLGQEVQELDDGLEITPQPVRSTIVQTYHDHRLAMAFAVAGTRAEGISIADPHCVDKTFPGFFDRLESLISP